VYVTDYLRPANVAFDDGAESKVAVLRRLVEILASSGATTNPEDCLSALLERERLMTTGVGKGVALPHAFSASAPETVIAYLRLSDGVEFDAVDGKPVNHIFCMLGPPDAQGRHLKILARLARLINSAGFTDALSAAADPESLLATFREQEEALQPHPG
jgi:mannitol/fructose-specific phosphotransferase system IIA component (Ntr-type)